MQKRLNYHRQIELGDIKENTTTEKVDRKLVSFRCHLDCAFRDKSRGLICIWREDTDPLPATEETNRIIALSYNG